MTPKVSRIVSWLTPVASINLLSCPIRIQLTSQWWDLWALIPYSQPMSQKFLCHQPTYIAKTKETKKAFTQATSEQELGVANAHGPLPKTVLPNKTAWAHATQDHRSRGFWYRKTIDGLPARSAADQLTENIVIIGGVVERESWQTELWLAAALRFEPLTHAFSHARWCTWLDGSQEHVRHLHGVLALKKREDTS